MYYNNSEYPPSTGTAFGVTDTIANFVDCYFWWYFSIVSVILFVVFTMTWPTKWNLWLFSSPVLAWMSTFFFLILGFIEWIIWKIFIHTKGFIKSKQSE